MYPECDRSCWMASCSCLVSWITFICPHTWSIIHRRNNSVIKNPPVLWQLFIQTILNFKKIKKLKKIGPGGKWAAAAGMINFLWAAGPKDLFLQTVYCCSHKEEKKNNMFYTFAQAALAKWRQNDLITNNKRLKLRRPILSTHYETASTAQTERYEWITTQWLIALFEIHIRKTQAHIMI